MPYHIHASQWAIRANVAIRSSKTAAPYSEYLSIFLATLTSRSKRAVFNKPINVVVWNRDIKLQFSNKKKDKKWWSKVLWKDRLRMLCISYNFHDEKDFWVNHVAGCSMCIFWHTHILCRASRIALHLCKCTMQMESLLLAGSASLCWRILKQKFRMTVWAENTTQWECLKDPICIFSSSCWWKQRC